MKKVGLAYFRLQALSLYDFVTAQGRDDRIDQVAQLSRLRIINYQYMPHYQYPAMNEYLKKLLKTAGTLGQFCLLFTACTAVAASLEVQLENRQPEGAVYGALHSAAGGWRSRPVALASSDNDLLQFADLPPGSYVLQVFQDVNGNNTLDLSRLGIPREPVGLSGNPPQNRGRPAASECLFEISEGENRISIRLGIPGRRTE